ncbi:MAG: hypothetical protein ICV87_12505 [Gemmatimonadetes bacterium]|nr:hypothetical protein [Gemmatimonadota bacterium]
MPKLTSVLAALLLAACAGDSAGGISREQFIRANVALRAVSDTAPQVDSLRARALRKEKVTPAQLRAWLRAHERNTELMADTWMEISKRVMAADSALRPPAPPPPSGPPPRFPVGGPEIAPPTPVPAPRTPPPPGPQPQEPPPVLSTPKVRDTASAPDSAA